MATIEKTFWRVDEWHRSGNGSTYTFYSNLLGLNLHMAGLTPSTAAETEGQEHTTVQSFTATSCDMDGWNNASQYGDVYHYTR